MKIAHSLRFYPKTSGLYETAREIIAEEIEQGHDARILDVKPNSTYSKYLYDRGIRSCDTEWFKGADIYVMHQMIPSELLKEIDKPIVVILHGTPEACYMSDIWEDSLSLTLIMSLIKDKRFSFVTLWERHFDFWNNIAPGRVEFIPSCVDSTIYDPEKVTPYQFGGIASGSPNILFADTWRIVKDPFHVVNAFKLFKQWHEKARLHIYCRPTDEGNKARTFFDRYLHSISEGKDSFFGIYDSFNPEIDRVMRGVDLVVTQQMDDTRVVREASVLGTPVIQPDSVYDYFHPKKFAEKIARVWEEILRGNPKYSRKEIRREAKFKYNPTDTINGLVKHFNKRLSMV
tara:strand:+ start:1495 stop:2529 length:1035 start_codon:yes stop_codon:yes gene_type:complete